MIAHGTTGRFQERQAHVLITAPAWDSGPTLRTEVTACTGKRKGPKFAAESLTPLHMFFNQGGGVKSKAES